MASKVIQRNSNGVRSIKPQNSLLCDMELPLRQSFFPLGFVIEVLTNRPEVLKAASESFGHRKLRYGSAGLQIRIGVSKGHGVPCPPLPLRREYNHLYSMVADAENQAILDLRSGENFVWLNEDALRDPLYLRHNFLEKVVYLLLGASVVTDIHAGCVSKDGKGILLCGDSGAGKSTLSYGCARAGWTYTSDDTCYLINRSRTPRVIGHAHRVRFRPTARELFPELNDREITPRMEGKPSIEVPLANLPPIDAAVEASISAAVYLRRYPEAQASLIPLPSGSATERFSQELYSAGEIRTKHRKLLGKFADIPAYELHYSDLYGAIQQLDRLVATL